MSSPKLIKIVNVPSNDEITLNKIKTKNTKTSRKNLKLTNKIQVVAKLKKKKIIFIRKRLKHFDFS
jgi:hypothetical protein